MTLTAELQELKEQFPFVPDDELAAMVARRPQHSDDPAILLPAIRKDLGLEAKIERVVRTTSTPPHYRLETDRGVVSLGASARWATRPTEFRAAFLDPLGFMPPLPKGAKRDVLFGMIVRAAEEEDIGEEATEDGETRAWLTQYLASRPPVASLEEAAAPEYPYIDDGCVVIFGQAFKRWVLLQHQEVLSQKKLGQRLRAVGCMPDKENVTLDGNRTSRSVWRLSTELRDARPPEQATPVTRQPVDPTRPSGAYA